MCCARARLRPDELEKPLPASRCWLDGAPPTLYMTGMSDPLEGTQVPDFDLESTEGKRIKPGDLRGSWTVLYFYPKDETSGCTAEACAFTACIGMFQKLNARVYGISRDSIASHQKFIEKNGLKFPLLADPKGQLM